MNHNARTMSANATYKNMPAAAVKIHSLIASLLDTVMPIYRPTNADREERKLKNRAFLMDMPEFRSTAKSPEKTKQKQYIIIYVLKAFHLCVAWFPLLPHT